MGDLPPLGPKRASDGPIILGGWDTVIIGGLALPGRCSVIHAGVKLKEDDKKKHGSSGGNTTFHGLHGQPFEVEVECWTDAQRSWLVGLQRQLLPQPGTKPKVQSFEHPGVEGLPSFSAVTVTGGTGLDRERSNPSVTKTLFHCKHHLPEKKRQTVTPKNAPVRNTRNKRREDSEQRNPKPTAQAGTVAPPFTSPSK